LQAVNQKSPPLNNTDAAATAADNDDDDAHWSNQPLSSLVADVQQTRAE